MENIKSIKADRNKTIVGYSNIRIWATFLVVVGHGTSLSIGTGGHLISPYSELSGLTAPVILEFIRSFIYSFHMPLFVALSGALFALTAGKAVNKVSWVGKRARRLLLPYLMTAVLFFIPVRFIVGYYCADENILGVLLNDVFLGADINYLWYVIMLFEINVIMILLIQLQWFQTKAGKISLFAVFAMLSILRHAVGDLPIQLHRTMEFLLWFYMGMQIESIRKRIKKESLKKAIPCIFAFFIVSFAVYQCCNVWLAKPNVNAVLLILLRGIRLGSTYLTAGLGCVFFFSAAFLSKKSKLKISALIDQHSFGIYLYHVPCMYLYTYVIQRLCPAASMTNLLYYVLVIGKMMIGLAAALAIDLCIKWLAKKAARRK